MGRPKGSKNKPKKPVVKITVQDNMERESGEGIYTNPSEESYKTKREIVEENYKKANIRIEEGSMPSYLSFEEFHEEACRRAEFRERVEGEKRHVEIEIETDKPVAIAFLSDLHVGNGGVDYELLRETGEIIKNHPLAYCITGGDITDSLFFDYGEEILNMQEQYVYMNKFLSWIGSENILAGIAGNHESWARKSGVSNYIEFSEHTKRPLLRGVSFVDLRVNGVPYRLLVAHKFRGESMYNPTHQQNRVNRELQGADIIMAAHTHKAGESTIYQPEYGGGARKVVLVNGKTFKKLDAYGKDQGYTPVTGEQVGCNWIILNHDKKMIRVASSNEEMVETMKGYF